MAGFAFRGLLLAALVAATKATNVINYSSVPPIGSTAPVVGCAPGAGIGWTVALYIGATATGQTQWFGPKGTAGVASSSCFNIANWANDPHDFASPLMYVYLFPPGVSAFSLDPNNPPQLLPSPSSVGATASAFTTRGAVIAASIKLPPRGSASAITGVYYNLPMAASSYRVAVYVQSSGGSWFGSKPTYGATYALAGDGSFAASNWASPNTNDENEPVLGVLLIPAGFRPTDANGVSSLPSFLMGAVVYSFISTRGSFGGVQGPVLIQPVLSLLSAPSIGTASPIIGAVYGLPKGTRPGDFYVLLFLADLVPADGSLLWFGPRSNPSGAVGLRGAAGVAGFSLADSSEGRYTIVAFDWLGELADLHRPLLAAVLLPSSYVWSGGKLEGGQLPTDLLEAALDIATMPRLPALPV